MPAAGLLTDFLNTDRDGADLLATPDGLAAWGRQTGTAEAGVWISPGDAAAARELRSALRVLLAGGGSGPLDTCAARVPLTLLVGADGTAELSAVRGGGDAPLGAVLAAILEAQTDGSWRRLKLCRDPACGRAFVDGSRNRSRAWCDMATCGSRSKMRAYRARRPRR